MRDCFLTWFGTSFSAITPARIFSPLLGVPIRIFSRATPGPATSVTMKCPVPRALGVLFILILEWEVTPAPTSSDVAGGGKFC